MQTKVVEQTSEKLVLKVTSPLKLKFLGLYICLIGVVVSLLGVLGILSSIGQLLSNSSFLIFLIIYILALIISFALFVLGISIALEAIVYFLIDTTCIFARSSRKLTIKNSKYLRIKFRPYEYYFDEIADITTVLSIVSGFESNGYKVYKLSAVLTSNKVIVISKAEQSLRNQEKQVEIVNLIQSYLS